jgi:hypothetical protein
MKFSMTGQEKYDLLIQVTSWEGLTIMCKVKKHVLPWLHAIHVTIG